MAKMRHAKIDYGCGTADLWGRFTAATVERFFTKRAEQCFGIRKSIWDFRLLSIAESDLPEPWARLAGAASVLKHNGDTIVWNARGTKIKSEWD